MKHITAVILASVLLLTGCTDQTEVEQGNGQASEATPESTNEWVQACMNFEPSSEKKYYQAYNEIIADVCEVANTEFPQISVEMSPTVDRNDAQLFIDSESFHLAYWSRFLGEEFVNKRTYIFSEDDQGWWEEKMKVSLKEPDLSWFTSTDEGGHCRVDPSGTCPKVYGPNETLSNEQIEFRFLGSRIEWANWQRLNSAHEIVHHYQDSNGMSHWSYWFVEGQATFYELAMARLLLNSDSIRIQYLVTSPNLQDKYILNPTDVDSVMAHINLCMQAREGECDAFRYGVGSLYHEKLVLDYGLDKYFEWQDHLNATMPKGNPAEFNQDEMETMIQTFDDSFREVFGISQSEWERNVIAPYIIESFDRL